MDMDENAAAGVALGDPVAVRWSGPIRGYPEPRQPPHPEEPPAPPPPQGMGEQPKNRSRTYFMGAVVTTTVTTVPYHPPF